MKRLMIPAAVLALGLGCDAVEGTFEGEPIDCTWFADTTNCWVTAVNEAAACTESDSVGTLNADRTACSYDNGISVTFEEALPTDLSDSDALLAHNWNSEVLAADGSSCASINTSTLGAVDLTVNSGVFNMAVVGLAGLQLTCPDGSKYYMEANLEDIQGSLEALSCLDFPGAQAQEVGEGGVALSLNAPSAVEDTEIFTCEPEAAPAE
jgi:hypothetical protein